MERPATSEPAPGSENIWHQMALPLMLSGRYLAFCSSVPNWPSIGRHIPWEMASGPLGRRHPADTRVNTSWCRGVRPAPPRWVGYVSPARPASTRAPWKARVRTSPCVSPSSSTGSPILEQWSARNPSTRAANSDSPAKPSSPPGCGVVPVSATVATVLAGILGLVIRTGWDFTARPGLSGSRRCPGRSRPGSCRRVHRRSDRPAASTCRLWHPSDRRRWPGRRGVSNRRPGPGLCVGR